MPFFEVGNEVWCDVDSKPYQFTIVRSRPNGTYDLQAKDGKKQFKVASSSIAPYHQIDGHSRTKNVQWNRQHLKIGRRVLIRSSPADGIAQGKGTIVAIGDEKKRCDIRCDDGSLELGIPSELLTQDPSATLIQDGTVSKKSNWIDVDEEPQFEIKEKVILFTLPKPGSLNESRYFQYGEIMVISIYII